MVVLYTLKLFNTYNTKTFLIKWLIFFLKCKKKPNCMQKTTPKKTEYIFQQNHFFFH